MYTNGRKKPKEPEINTLRCCPMDPTKIRNDPNQPKPLSLMDTNEEVLDPEVITRRYQNLQYYNYLQYVNQMQKATGSSFSQNPLGLSFPMDFPQVVQIEGMPPGRPKSENEKINITKASMTYGDYRRLNNMTEPVGVDYPFSSATNGNQRSQYNDPRGRPQNGRNRSGPQVSVDDGWGNDNSSSKSQKLSKPKADDDDDWDNDLPSTPIVNKKATVTSGNNDDDWDSLITPKPCSSKAAPKKSGNDNDEWDLPSTSIPVQSKSLSKPNNSDWDDFAPVAQSKPSVKKSRDDDWSDDDGSAPAKKFCSIDQDTSSRGSSYSGSSRGRGGGDRFMSNRGRGGQENSNPRQPRDDDWTCTKCSTSNYASRYSCHRCKEPKEGRSSGVKREPRDDDWTCSKCSVSNYASRYSCHRCKEPKEGRSSGVKREPRDDDWTCSKCSVSNYASRYSCHRCKEPKEAAGGSSNSGRGYRDSSRGSYRGSRGGRGGSQNFESRDNQSSGSSFNQLYTKVASSGWSDEEGDKSSAKKITKHQANEDDDGWGDSPKKAEIAKPKVTIADDDDWGSLESKVTRPNLPVNDEWDAPVNFQKNVPKPQAASDDEWASLGAPTTPQTDELAVKHLLRGDATQAVNDDDDWTPDKPTKEHKPIKQSHEAQATSADDDWNMVAQSKAVEQSQTSTAPDEWDNGSEAKEATLDVAQQKDCEEKKTEKSVSQPATPQMLNDSFDSSKLNGHKDIDADKTLNGAQPILASNDLPSEIHQLREELETQNQENEKVNLELRTLKASTTSKAAKYVQSHWLSKENYFEEHQQLSSFETISRDEKDSNSENSKHTACFAKLDIIERPMNVNDNVEALSCFFETDDSESDSELCAFILAKATSFLREHDSVESATSVLKQIHDDECSLVNKLIEVQRAKAESGDWDIPCISEVAGKSKGESWKNFDDFHNFVLNLKGKSGESKSEEPSYDEAYQKLPQLRSVVVIPSKRSQHVGSQTCEDIPRIDKSCLMNLKREIMRIANQDSCPAPRSHKYTLDTFELPKTVRHTPDYSYRYCVKSQRKISKQFLAMLRKQILETVDVKPNNVAKSKSKTIKVKRKLLKDLDDLEEGELTETEDEVEVSDDSDNDDIDVPRVNSAQTRGCGDGEGVEALHAITLHDCMKLQFFPPVYIGSEADMNMQEPLDVPLTTASRERCERSMLTETKAALYDKADKRVDTCGEEQRTKPICVAIDTDDNVVVDPLREDSV